MKTQRREEPAIWASNLFVTQQMGGCAGVEQCSEDVMNTALELPLQCRPPFRRMAFGTFGARISDTFGQLG